MLTILLVEDDDGMLKMLKQLLSENNYNVIVATNGVEGIEKFRQEKIDLVVTDLKLPKKDGLEVLKVVNNQNHLIPVILMTAHATIEIAIKAVKEGAYEFLQKPFDPDHLLLLINKALEKQRLLTENIILKDEFSGYVKFPRIIGKSQEIIKSIEKIKKVASEDTIVLLQGESGTGKEVFARAIHYLSNRKEEQFVAINCAAIPRDLLESELFGHEKGAFTGAAERKLGKFELADKGTIFLDEIGDMDITLQAKILRVLEEDGIMRVGGTSRIKIDVRVIAATNKNLQQEISRQNFREDLFYRITTFPILIPPLRDRVEDIPILIEYFISYFCKEMNRKEKKVSNKAMELLTKYSWPGNIRELQNCIERAVILSEGQSIDPEHLSLRSDDFALKEMKIEGPLHQVSANAVRIVEEKLIRKVLESTSGNKSRASEILEVSYKTLLTKIKDYGIE